MQYNGWQEAWDDFQNCRRKAKVDNLGISVNLTKGKIFYFCVIYNRQTKYNENEEANIALRLLRGETIGKLRLLFGKGHYLCSIDDISNIYFYNPTVFVDQSKTHHALFDFPSFHKNWVRLGETIKYKAMRYIRQPFVFR